MIKLKVCNKILCIKQGLGLHAGSLMALESLECSRNLKTVDVTIQTYPHASVYAAARGGSETLGSSAAGEA